MSDWTVRGLTAKSVTGNETTISDPTATGLEIDGGEFTYTSDERISQMTIGTGEDGAVLTVAFDTDAGNSFSSIADVVRKGNYPALTFNKVEVGSGVLARIRGVSCDTGYFGSLGFDFLDELASVQITNIDYSGFTNGIKFGDIGTPLSVGSIVTDNRNSTALQRVTFLTQEATTWQRTITTEGSLMIGMTTTVGGKVGIPLVSEGSVSVAATWALTAKLSRADMDASTSTRAATFWLDCPEGKLCRGNCFYTQFKMTVDMEATFTATTKTGATYSWVQNGVYDTADSSAMQFNVTQIDKEGAVAALDPSAITPVDDAADAVGSGVLDPELGDPDLQDS